MDVLSNEIYKTENSKLRALLEEIRDGLIGKQTGVIYGFHIEHSESDPEDKVTYLEGAAGMTPAGMNYTSGIFNWGSWRDAFFMPRPCMLKFDGTVDYYLDPNDYTKKYDGTASDVADITYGGNAMMEWGQNGKRIYYKIVPDTSNPKSADVFIADYLVDETYQFWSFVNNQGVLVDHFYTPIYNGTIDSSGRLRSISGIANSSLCNNKTAPQEIEAAEKNNPSTNKLWFTEVNCDVVLISLLLILMAKSTDSQTAYGQGRCAQSSGIANCLGTGTMNDKGLFWGSNANTYGVKVFGMENFWGNQWRRFAGLMLVDGVYKYKMTRGNEDGSVATDYNTTGADYINSGISAPSASGSQIDSEEFNVNMFVPKTVAGTSSQDYCSAFWSNLSGQRYALRGGGCADTAALVGLFCLGLSDAPGDAYWYLGAAPSCKPLS